MLALGRSQIAAAANSTVLSGGYNAVPPTLFAPLNEICGEINIIKTLFYARLAAV